MKMVMRAVRTVVEEYSIELDSNYIDDINQTLHRFYSDAPDVNEDMVQRIVNARYEDKDLHVQIHRIPLGNYNLYDDLYVVLRDWIEEDLWNIDCEPEQIDSEIEDVEMFMRS